MHLNVAHGDFNILINQTCDGVRMAGLNSLLSVAPIGRGGGFIGLVRD